MAPYLILFAFLAIGAITVAMRPVEPYRGSLVIPAIVLVIMIGLRREVGGDWWNYLDMFRYIQLADFARALERTEPGYALVNGVGAQLGLGIWFVNLVCAAIFTWGLIALCRQQPNPWLALVVSTFAILVVGMGFTRQSAALGFVMLALAQYSRRPNLRMVIYLALATLFHTSAVAAALLIGLASARERVSVAALIIASGAFLYLEYSGGILGRLDIYAEGRGGVPLGALPRLLMNVVPAVIFLAFRPRFASSRREVRLWTIFALAAFAALALLYAFPLASVVPDRLSFYIIPLQIVVLSRLPAAFGSAARNNMFFVASLVAYALTIQVVWLTQGYRSLAWLPYKNYAWDWGPGGQRPAKKETR